MESNASWPCETIQPVRCCSLTRAGAGKRQPPAYATSPPSGNNSGSASVGMAACQALTADHTASP
ncbi:hypothetical protein QP028_02105 [Corynebacterium suedekumii]|nr:hypothetical protein QP028_02105 [Corynebacterium suedekumii]